MQVFISSYYIVIRFLLNPDSSSCFLPILIYIVVIFLYSSARGKVIPLIPDKSSF